MDTKPSRWVCEIHYKMEKMEVFQSVEPCYTWSFLVIYLPFDFQTWLTSNFSLKYPFIIQQPSNENTQTYLVEVVILTYDQILVTNLQGNV